MDHVSAIIGGGVSRFFFTLRNIMGTYRKCVNNLQIIIRNAQGCLKITYFLTALLSAQLRYADKQERITYDTEDLHHLRRIGNTPYDNDTTRTDVLTSCSVSQPGVV